MFEGFVQMSEPKNKPITHLFCAYHTPVPQWNPPPPPAHRSWSLRLHSQAPPPLAMGVVLEESNAPV